MNRLPTLREIDNKIGQHLVKLAHLDEERDTKRRMIRQMMADNDMNEVPQLQRQVQAIDCKRQIVIGELDGLNSARGEVLKNMAAYSGMSYTSAAATSSTASTPAQLI